MSTVEVNKLVKGKVTLSNGAIQEGEWKDGRFVKGKVTYPCDKSSKGEWKITYPNGTIKTINL